MFVKAYNGSVDPSRELMLLRIFFTQLVPTQYVSFCPDSKTAFSPRRKPAGKEAKD